MYLLYMDASGTPEPQDLTDVYAVVGLAVPEDHWDRLCRDVATLKRRYGLVRFGGELHAKDFCVTISAQSRIPGFEGLSYEERRTKVVDARATQIELYTGAKRKQKMAHYRNTLPFVHLTRAERSQLLEDALDLIGQDRRLRLFGEAITKSDCERDVVRRGFAQVVSRFNQYLARRRQRNKTARKHKGLLVMDQEPSREEAYRAMLGTFQSHTDPWGRPMREVIEAPFFVDSSHCAAVQLADIAAYALRRHVRVPNGEHERANLQRIWARFDRSGTKLHGVRHYCNSGTCSCVICAARQHGTT